LSTLAELVVRISGDTAQLTAALGRAEKHTSGFSDKVGKALKVAAVAGAGALAGLGVASLKLGMDFEKSMAEVKTLLPEISGEAFGKMKDDVLKFSAEMGIATDKAVPALYQAISAGIPTENVMEFMKVASKASIGGVTDLETAVDGLTTVVNAFGLSAADTGRVADVMFTGVRLGKTTMGELSTSMFQAAPLAASLGLSIEDVVGATATLTKSGTPTAQAMTQIRQSMVALSKPNADMVSLLEKTGYASGEALLQSEGLAGALDILSTAAAGNKEEMGKAFGSVEALQAVLGLTGENAEVAAADLAAVKDSTGAADKAFETMADTASYKLTKAINQVKVGMTYLGAKVLPVLVQGFERLMPWLEQNLPIAMAKLEEVWKKLEPVREAFVAGLRILMDVGMKVTKFLSEHREALIAVGVALGIVVIALNPIPAAILAIILAVGYLSQHWDDIKAKTLEVWSSISDFLDEKLGFLKGIFATAFEYYRNIAVFWFEEIKNYIQTVLNVIRDIIRFVMAVLHGDWATAWDALKQIVVDVWEGIKGAIMPAVDLIRNQLQLLWDKTEGLRGFLVDKFQPVWTGLSWVLGAAEGAFGKVRDAVQWVIDRIHDLKGAVEDALGPLGKLIDKAGDFMGMAGGLAGKIPGFQFGGITPYSGLFKVGEAGTEVVALPRGSRVYPHSDSERILHQTTTIGKQGGLTNYGHMTVQVVGGSGEDVLRQLERRFR